MEQINNLQQNNYEFLRDNTKTAQYYDAIGFDADCTLLRYDVMLLSKVGYNSFLKTILEQQDFIELQKKYPQINQKDYFMVYYNDDDLIYGKMQNLKEYNEMLQLGINYSLIDVDAGTVVQLNQNSKVIDGYQGVNRLNKQQIQEIYGENQIADYNIDNCRTQKRFINVGGFFDTFISVLYMKLYQYFVDIKEKIDNRDIYHKIIINSLLPNYRHYNENETFSIKNFGNFYPLMLKYNKEIVLNQQERMKNILKSLKNKKLLFLVTNSHFELLNASMTTAYGQDWQSLFDLVIVYAQKPSNFFFDQNEKNQVYFYDENLPKKRKEEAINIDSFSIENKQILVQGNYEFVQKVIQKKQQIQNPKIVYFGDGYFSDNYFTEKNTQWDSIFLCEEINLEIYQGKQYQYKQIVDYRKNWTSYFGKDQENISFYWNHIKNTIKGGIFSQVDSDFSVENFWK